MSDNKLWQMRIQDDAFAARSSQGRVGSPGKADLLAAAGTLKAAPANPRSVTLHKELWDNKELGRCKANDKEIDREEALQNS
jgi:hypothetical protein